MFSRPEIFCYVNSKQKENMKLLKQMSLSGLQTHVTVRDYTYAIKFSYDTFSM